MLLRRRATEGRVLDRRTADLVRGAFLYGATAVVAGGVGCLIVVLSGSAI
jgi:hypothetical protein